MSADPSASKYPATEGAQGERQPLLTPGDVVAYERNDEENARTPLIAPTEDDEEEVVPKEPWGWKWWTFYGVLGVTGIVLLALLIKGFIDSGDVDFDLGKALKSALGGGLSGAAAMVLQVLTLMPLRTVMNYQYRYGTTTTQAIETLYHDGGWTRYYQGLSAALVQGPVSRFGDTAANAGILALLQSNSYLKHLPPLIKTIFASLAAAAFRMILTPVDTLKTTLQTQGKPGLQILRARIKKYGVATLWYGALATAAATFVGHYPWFGTYNYLEANLPPAHTLLQKLGRRAFIGFVASVVSDTVSNSLRVIKTYRQVNETRIGYVAAAKAVIEVDGWCGLFGRGLKTRIIANGLQGLMFSVLWRFFLDLWNEKTK
ncbi:mitochondrial carrier domain-containing protein [Crucibulum laeve]|uniref:Mitochondrial carrier domain-containing protein n=1 Tax=Crucibulum laeve TaxID=68775 RepID=A0A5C3M1X9_9AGAR|nr:mitochondrial carrier domain-containing protein [Crucibulum laeve]